MTMETRDVNSSLIQTECQRNVTLQRNIKPFPSVFQPITYREQAYNQSLEDS